MAEHNLLNQPLISVDEPLTKVNVSRWQHGELSHTQDQVAEEVPIALIYNGVSHAVMLATPLDLEDFALGFSLSEGIIRDKSDCYDIEIVKQTQGIELRLTIATECFVNLKERRRNLVGRTGCGLCGAESLEQALRLPQIQTLETSNNTDSNHYRVGLQANTYAPFRPLLASHIQAAFYAIQSKQTLLQATGATHACALVNAQGEIELIREDVGRHNAMDKLIGAIAKQSMPENGFVLTSSRASVEMVQKVAAAGIHILAAISAPTGLAIRVALTYNITLIGFLREQQFVIYTHQDRIQF